VSSSRPDLPAGGIPLAILRADLDQGWPAGARWSTSGGLGGAVLEQPVGARLAFRLRAEGARLRLRGDLELAAGGRRQARVRVRVSTLDRSGAETPVWARTLRKLRGRNLPSRRRLDADFEIAEEAVLVLSASGPGGETVRWSGAEIAFEDAPREELPSTPPPSQPAAAAKGGAGEPGRPRFSVLTPVHDPPLELLEETIASVLGQSFEDWELCLVDDGSSNPEVRKALRRSADADSRIHLLRRESAGGIATATNAALEMAAGEFVALLDHDDLLLPDALASVDAALGARPDADMAYSDEELIEEGGVGFTFAKPHWSPDLLRSQMYTCHLGVYRRSLAQEIGGFRSEFDGSQDYDFALRISERTDRVVHIPRVLYHWRAHAGSTAASTQAKPSAYPAARRAIAQHLERTGVDADVHFGPWQGIYRVVHRVPPSAQVAVGIVAEAEGEAVKRLLAAVREETGSGLANPQVTVAATVAEAAERCSGADAIVLCEGAVEPLTRYWLARLAGFALQPGVAAVGARTLAPDGRVEEAGAAVEAGLPVPIMYATGAGDPGPLGIGLLPANVSTLGGVVAFGGETFRGLGGLDEEAGHLAVADYCLRALSAGLRIVSTPDVLLRRCGRGGAVNDLAELERFRRRWAAEFARDSYFDLSVEWPGVGATAAGSG
jgi:GT2 family glycosyltransferase